MPHGGQTGVLIEHGGLTLLGTLLLARGDEPKPTALVLHGIPGIEKNYDIALALREAGWNAFILHYRGCWGSSGSYDVRTIPEDIRAAVDNLSTGDFSTVDPGRIVCVGHSLGGWAALLAAASDNRIRAALSIAGITIPETMPFADPAYSAGYTPWLSGISPEGLAEQWQAIGPALTPIRQVHRINPRPLLVIHSAADDAVPVENGRQLALAAPWGRYIEHPDANHSFTWHRGWLIDTVLRWIRELPLADQPGA